MWINIWQGATDHRQLSSIYILEFWSKNECDKALDKLNVNSIKDYTDQVLKFARAESASQLKQNTVMHKTDHVLKTDVICKDKSFQTEYKFEGSKDRVVKVNPGIVFLQKSDNMIDSLTEFKESIINNHNGSDGMENIIRELR